MWRNNVNQHFKTVRFLLLAGFLAGCEATIVPDLTSLATRDDVGGLVVADEPQAVLLTREILNAGGSAADGAVAMGFGLSVTLQSRAGLGGGGTCLVYDSGSRRAEVLDFTPVAAQGYQESARWQVAVPTLARGLFALHAKYGRLPWQQVVVPAENIVRFENVVSRALSRDLSTASASLVNDPQAMDTFMTGRRMAQEGDRLQQLDLAATIGRLRGRTPGDFYSGSFATTVDRNSASAGASLSAEDLRAYVPHWRVASSTRVGGVEVYSSMDASAHDRFAANMSDAASIRQKVVDQPQAATGFIVADASGNVVSCSLTMVEPFGNGLMPSGLGFLLAPSLESEAVEMPALPSVVAVATGSGEAVYAAASGGEGSIEKVAISVSEVLTDGKDLPSVLPEDGETYTATGVYMNAFRCKRGLAQDIRACEVRTDPSGHGFGLIALGEK